MKTTLHSLVSAVVSPHRDSRYKTSLVVSAIVFALCCALSKSNAVLTSIEVPVFNFFNTLPKELYGVMAVLTQIGGLGGLVLWGVLAWRLISIRAVLIVLGGGLFAWTLAKVIKQIVQRQRPEGLLANVNVFGSEHLGGYGFPSGHSTFSAACATILYYQVAAKYRPYFLALVALVGVSRMYLGAHFPLDVVAGWALGVCTGSALALLLGISSKTYTKK